MYQNVKTLALRCSRRIYCPLSHGYGLFLLFKQELLAIWALLYHKVRICAVYLNTFSITCTNSDVLPLDEVWFKLKVFTFRKMCLRMSCAKCRRFVRLTLNGFIILTVRISELRFWNTSNKPTPEKQKPHVGFDYGLHAVWKTWPEGLSGQNWDRRTSFFYRN